MTFLSYAQNFEDVLLWRALKDIPAGFYIDVGAWHPDTDSVTRAFYDRGWHGINIEPVAEYHRLLAAARPRDICLQVALGATTGEASFHAIPDTGLSTLYPTLAERAARAGFAVHTWTVPLRTLADICAAHAPADIHFLKVDAEGAEQAVLEGADFAAARPWIVLLEAVAPLDGAPSHAAWEPILLRAGYRFVWFDGLNRFYVAAEHYARLAPHFVTPPNVFDGFIRPADNLCARELGRLEQRALSAEARALDAMRGGTLRRLLASVRRGVRWLGGPPAPPPPGTLAAPLPLPDQPAAAAAPRFPTPAARLPAAPPRPPTRTVHQFHPGSAPHDAITNAMFLIRGLLRDLGYASEVYVEHRHPALTDQCRLIDELPTHADYVLIAHHSLGYDAYPQIVALPASKVLVYHNITPPELLGANPRVQADAVLGRIQLADWRGHAVAALADSDYNALELRAAGFAHVRTCMLLFDLRDLRARAAGAVPSRGGATFTILFVGRIAEHKAQDALVEAFAAFRRDYDAAARLVLVGGYGDDDDPYLHRLVAVVQAAGLDRDVLLTGLIPDDARDAWYAAADLYVSLSHHEGFGVPLVEAMAHGVPVLAWPSGAIPATLGEAGEWLDSRDPAVVGAHIAALARDPARRAAIAAAQRSQLDRFGLENNLAVLQEAIVRAGGAPPAAVPTRDRLPPDAGEAAREAAGRQPLG